MPGSLDSALLAGLACAAGRVRLQHCEIIQERIATAVGCPASTPIKTYRRQLLPPGPLACIERLSLSAGTFAMTNYSSGTQARLRQK